MFFNKVISVQKIVLHIAFVMPKQKGARTKNSHIGTIFNLKRR